jgi:hypothetical protein
VHGIHMNRAINRPVHSTLLGVQVNLEQQELIAIDQQIMLLLLQR